MYNNIRSYLHNTAEIIFILLTIHWFAWHETVLNNFHTFLVANFVDDAAVHTTVRASDSTRSVNIHLSRIIKEVTMIRKTFDELKVYKTSTKVAAEWVQVVRRTSIVLTERDQIRWLVWLFDRSLFSDRVREIPSTGPTVPGSIHSITHCTSFSSNNIQTIFMGIWISCHQLPLSSPFRLLNMTRLKDFTSNFDEDSIHW